VTTGFIITQCVCYVPRHTGLHVTLTAHLKAYSHRHNWT